MVYNGSMNTPLRLTKENQKTFGVPASVHAHAVLLAKRQGLKLWETIADALVVYDRLNPQGNGSDQDGQS